MNKTLKRLQVTTLGTCLALALGTGVISTTAHAVSAAEIRAAQSVKISLRQAVSVALRDVLDDISVILINADFDYEDNDSTSGGGVYDLEFTDGKAEYKIKVDARTARVVDTDTDSLDDSEADDYERQKRAKINIKDVINTVEDRADSLVLGIEFIHSQDYPRHPTYYQVDRLRGDQIMELKINAETGREFERKIKR